MALHHFIWQGKERAVSLNREQNNQILLDFVDDEIIHKVSPRIVVGAQSDHLLNEKEIISKEAAQDLIHAIEQGVGRPMKALLDKTSFVY